ncbi:hypothetical protein QFC22_006313 [Naganishia vaughanmartiniae]|uniref:Uncharacterized protein n=1 Tax=Naganishia vaughanmartiniae TaxID=1424756 RepID=A0ACC2WM39_9TREE|nr:hypothetical protein QFC22_006313 [Naganishia vaughanmartiniae]
MVATVVENGNELPDSLQPKNKKGKGAPTKLEKARKALKELITLEKRQAVSEKSLAYDPLKVRESDDPMIILRRLQHGIRAEKGPTDEDLFLARLSQD